MSKPLVSVLMPVYDAEATLDEALESLAVQSLEDFEVVAVDDGSTDGSAGRLAEWRKRDGRIRPIYAEHRGLIEALNAGLAVCRGALVARMDADDRCHPARLERQAARMASASELSVVGCLVELFPEGQVAEGFRIYVDWLNRLTTDEEIGREIFIESPIVHPSAMVRREELLGLGGYLENGWAEDYDLWLRYRAAGRRFAKVEETLLFWREHERRLTRTDGRYSVENFLRAKAHYLIAGPLRGRQLVIWGAGRTGRRLSKHLIRGGCRPVYFVDIDARKIGGRLRGVEVIGAAALEGALADLAHPLVLAAVASRGARQLIRARLTGFGLVEGEGFLCVA